MLLSTAGTVQTPIITVPLTVHALRSSLLCAAANSRLAAAGIPLLSSANPDSGASGEGKSAQECISPPLGSSAVSNQQPLNCNLSELPMTSFTFPASRTRAMDYPTAESLVLPPTNGHHHPNRNSTIQFQQKEQLKQPHHYWLALKGFHFFP